jgi:hypothetical protein
VRDLGTDHRRDVNAVGLKLLVQRRVGLDRGAKLLDTLDVLAHRLVDEGGIAAVKLTNADHGDGFDIGHGAGMDDQVRAVPPYRFTDLVKLCDVQIG